MSEEMQTFSVRMEPSLVKAVRVAAIQDGFNGRCDLIRELVRVYLDRREQEPPTRIETLFPTGVPVEDR